MFSDNYLYFCHRYLECNSNTAYMFVTTLKFSEVLERFYEENKYDFLLLFVSSFDGKDKEILKQIVDNAKRIDKITGERICFFYFIQDSFDSMNQKLTRWVRNLSNWQPLYGEGVSVTMETSDDICGHFGILRSYLPAFILVPKDRREEPQIISVKDYQDLESLLSPLNTLNSYLFDRYRIISDYECKKQNTITQETIEKRRKQRISWSGTIQYLERKKARAGMDCTRFDSEIQKLQKNLEDYPELHAEDVEGSVEYPVQRLLEIKDLAINRLDITLNSHEGGWLVEQVENASGYSNAVLKIWNLVRTRGVRISRIVEYIRNEIYERGFDVFISCKSQDYAQARGVYEYLKTNGFKPFLADHTLKEIGVDQYTAVIGEVINVCKNMVVFTTNVDYLDTPYVHAEWHAFINDMNTGHKPNARLVNVLSPDIDIHKLPGWLRDKQCFTTENYRDDLLLYLKGGGNEMIERLRYEIDDSYYRYRCELDKLYTQDVQQMFGESIFRIDREKDYLFERLDRCKPSYELMEIECAFNKWEQEFLHLIRAMEEYKKDEEKAWREAFYESDGGIKPMMEYLKRFPFGLHAEEAKFRLDLLRSYEQDSTTYRKGNTSSMPELDNSHYKERMELLEIKSIDYKNSYEAEELFLSHKSESVYYSPSCSNAKSPKSYRYASFWDRLFNRKTYDTFSSIFAPAQIKPNSHMLVQVYLHLQEETEIVKRLAQESQKDAQRRDYIPLQCKLKKGDKVDVLLNIYGESLLMSDKKSMVWQGSFTKCSFNYRVPNDINVDDLSCKAIFVVGGVPVGEMNFITSIVDKPRPIDPVVISHKYEKVFISYAHKDEGKVKFLAQGLELMGVDHFFDRKYLKAGDVFPQVIQNYINSADLFVLCWSENASQSEYVKKEYMQALERAYPQIKPQEDAKLSIYPMSIEPRAELPEVMKDNYHFGEI